MSKLKLEDIRKEITNLGWTLLEEKYTNLNTEMRMVCPEGHTISLSLKQFRKNHSCPICENNPLKKNSNNIKIPKKNGIRILALDQATTVSGWSIFDGEELINYGKFDVSGIDTLKRLNKFSIWLMEQINKWNPDLIVFEDIQFQKGVNGESEDAVKNTVIYKTLAQLQGIIMCICLLSNLDYLIVPPATWRHFCGITGKYRNDKKRSAQLKIKEWYDISVTQDEADSICIGKYAANAQSKAFKMFVWE